MNVRHIIRSILLENVANDLSLNRYVYHTSNPRNRKSIDKQGLRPRRGVQWLADTPLSGKAIFATNSENRDDWFDSTYDDDVWRIDITKCQEVRWDWDPNFIGGHKQYHHVYTKQTIPRHALKLIKKGTGKDLEDSDENVKDGPKGIDDWSENIFILGHPDRIEFLRGT